MWIGLKFLRCPSCNYYGSRVIDSRDSGEDIRRRRECSDCQNRFTSYERVQTRVLMVSKIDNRREEFDRDKLWSGLAKACAKCPLPPGSVEKLVQEMEETLLESGRYEISSRVIGEMAMDKLKTLDRIAYIRFASVYRDFKDIETFKVEVDALLTPESPMETSNQLSYLEDESVMPRRRKRRLPRKKTVKHDSG